MLDLSIFAIPTAFAFIVIYGAVDYFVHRNIRQELNEQDKEIAELGDIAFEHTNAIRDLVNTVALITTQINKELKLTDSLQDKFIHWVESIQEKKQEND